MRVARVPGPRGERTVVSVQDGPWVPVASPPGEPLVDLLAPERRAGLLDVIARRSGDAPEIDLGKAATVLDPGGDIWGAGLNYDGHSRDLDAVQPASAPGSYLRPHGCLVGNGGNLEVPARSARVTAEAELGLVIGSRCRDVPRTAWRDVVAAVTVVLDLTAEDAIRENPRHIPWAKGFDTFCSIGPLLISLDEFDDEQLAAVTVSTVRNYQVVASAPVAAMRHDPGFLVEYFTAGRTLPAGSAICTGTPGAAAIAPGDRVTAIVEGVGALHHPVV